MEKKSKYKGIPEMVISFILAFSIIIIFFKEDKNFEELALGIYTKSYFAKQDGVQINSMGFRERDEVLNGIKSRKKKHFVFMVGNSQSHSINQFKIGFVTFPELLADSLKSQSTDVITSSVPNATLQDFYLLYHGWKQYFKMDLIIIPVFLDDTRENELRLSFYENIKNFRINDTNIVAQKINEQLTELTESKSNELAGLRHTYQEVVEDSLDKFLDKHFIPWHLRPNIRGDVFNNLYKLRNTIFGIDAKTKRGIIPDLYAKNLNALKMLLEDCKKDHVKVLLYIPPLRSDYPIPYVDKEYMSFKKEIEEIAISYGVSFSNLEHVIPNKYWGFKGTRTLNGVIDIDFMHFQYPGHIIMGKELQKQIQKLIIQ